MIILSNEALFDAIFVIVSHFFIAGTLALFYIYQGRKTKTKLLFYFGLGIFGISITFGLSTFIDFLTILITGNHMHGNLKLFMVWAPGAFTAVFSGYVMLEILMPKKKWYFLSLILTLSILYLLDLFVFHWTTDEIIYPTNGLVITNHAKCVPGFCQVFPFRWMVFSQSYNIIIGVGLLYKAYGTSGIFRKKYFYLSTSRILFSLSRILRAKMSDIWYGWNFFFLTFDLASFVIAYLGLRAEPEERIKKVKKKITTKDSLFRIIERPDQITEEEVTYYKEQKICLVCKGKVAGFNAYICPNCEA
ncbi:MAG: hypothetical protein ACFFDN_47655, partial [Candidatus Hodarchaeota archaeon]